MSEQSLTEKYFTALASGDGALAESLFTPDGTLDDLRGGHHHGGDAIHYFIDHRPPLKVEILSGDHHEGSRITVYGLIHYGSGEEAKVRWLFTESNGSFEHLCNSRVDRLPDDRLDRPAAVAYDFQSA